MILGPIRLIDLVVFALFLAPQFAFRVGVFRTVLVALRALPFILIQLPVQLIRQRYFTSTVTQPKFIQESTLFEDLLVRTIRYAFATIPPRVGQVFFSKWVWWPLLRWRMLRHGYLKSPVRWQEYAHGKGRDRFQGIWITHRPEQTPDVVVYYVHGGGFSLGSAHFYLEFLMLWHTLLLQAGYQNPAVFSLEYTLVPEGVYPKQVNEVLQGYNHVLDVAKDPSKVFVGGDSAGGTLTLSLLQELGAQGSRQKLKSARPDPRGSLGDQRPLGLPLPRMAILISPWVTLRSNLHSASRVDYLNRETAWKYAHEYAGEPMINRYPASPGSCTDDNIWRQSSPEGGIYVIYGEEEVFAPDIESFLKRQERHGLQVRAERIEGGIHAWPVASLLASNTNERRLYGLRCIVNEMKRRTVGQVGVQRRRAKKSD